MSLSIRKLSTDTALFAVTFNVNLPVKLFNTFTFVEFIGIAELDIIGYVKGGAGGFVVAQIRACDRSMSQLADGCLLPTPGYCQAGRILV